MRSWESELSPLQRISDQPDGGRPQSYEQSAPLGIASLVLIDGLGPNPQSDAQADRAERQELQVPGPQPGVVEGTDERRLVSLGAADDLRSTHVCANLDRLFRIIVG